MRLRPRPGLVMSEPTTPPPCPSPAELRAFAVGDLGAEDIDRIAGHVLRCEPCDRALWSLDGTTDWLVRSLTGLTADGQSAEPLPGPLLQLARSGWRSPGGGARPDVSLDSGRRLARMLGQ